VILAEACRLADDGLALPDRFLTQTDMGFPAVEQLGESFPTDPAWRRALAPLADRIGVVATVSTCSGADAQAAEIAYRTNGALAEDMESAAVGLVAARLGVPFACLRVVSNHTGDREAQRWDLDLAFSVLARLARSL
jgi:futalosine hydrolase